MGGKILKTSMKEKVDQPFELLMASVKSANSRLTYKTHYNTFLKFSEMKNGQQLIDTTPKKLTEIIIAWILELKKEVNPNTIPTYLTVVKSFLEINDVELKWKKIKKFYPARVKKTGQNAYSTEQVKKMLSVTRVLQHIALIHFYCSTGCRVGAIYDETTNRPLCIGDLRDMPYDCQMVTVYPDTIEEYKTFLTPEAVIAIEDYLSQRRNKGEILNNESPVFVTFHGKPMKAESVKQIIKRAISVSNVRGQTKNGRYAIQLMHGFRKRFNTIMKLNNSVNDNAIEKMMGHKNGLDGTYLQIPDERLFEEFYKGMTDLTISSEERDQITITKLQNTVPKDQEIISQIMPKVMTKLREELGLDKITPSVVDTLSKQELQNLVKNFITE